MFDKRSGDNDFGSHWILIIGVLTALAFFVNYVSYLFDITDTVANLFLIPVIIAAFIFQKKGFYYSVFVMLLYILFVVYMAPGPAALVDAGEHAIIMAGIALIITLLSIALHRSEDRYRLFFETSPAPFVVTDSSGEIIDVNENFFRIFGYDKNFLLGKNIQDAGFIAEEDRDMFSEHIAGRDAIHTPEKPLFIHIQDINGTLRTCRLFLSTLYDEDGDIDIKMIGLVDITENVLAERRIKLSLKEKEMLLREVHHRVKNNLQVIVSLLKLQYNRTGDSETKDTLRDCQNRIYSMAMVHEKFYRSDNLAVIDICEYLEALSANILMEYSEMTGRVDVDVSSAGDISLDTDTIVPCALITNELLTNSLKYAFPGNRPGHINIEISGGENNYRYIYRDDGIGIPAGFNPDESDTLGMKIVNSLVRQIRGQIEINSDSGTEIIITFPNKKIIKKSAGW